MKNININLLLINQVLQIVLLVSHSPKFASFTLF